ncbi:uncharacterized protein LOC106173463 [Lingula anatina]|uniref:Uncharacterized protein LOC106173463 n=1 Tax=Lingula anatina TaxID=7574 RepID=A0A1S3JI66_LINAN|nr:uncharacterized protein LOC106173463 [Lingula anatina]|eukprot:XP_013410058.1 uncharacterized protein LOC106173463 [Lingula anatina]
MRKTEEPHKLQIEIGDKMLSDSFCSCKARLPKISHQDINILKNLKGNPLAYIASVDVDIPLRKVQLGSYLSYQTRNIKRTEDSVHGIGATPDRKLCDNGQTGIAEIKYPFTARNMKIWQHVKTFPIFVLKTIIGK